MEEKALRVTTLPILLCNAIPHGLYTYLIWHGKDMQIVSKFKI